MTVATVDFSRRRTKRVLVGLGLLLATGLFAAACGDDDGIRTSTGSDGPSDAPSGAEVAVQVLVAGGFTTPEAAASTVPTVTVLSDGTVITPAPVPAIYPGPAIPPLQRATVSTGRVTELLDRADELGLLRDDLDFGEPPVADAPDTAVTIVAGGATYVHVARALGFDDGAADSLSDEQRGNRAALREFLAATDALPPGEEPYVPESVIVTVVGPYVPDDLPQQPRDWPLATPPNLDGDFPCTELTGAEATELLAALEGANQRTPWVIDGDERTVAFRPAVPGHARCE